MERMTTNGEHSERQRQQKILVSGLIIGLLMNIFCNPLHPGLTLKAELFFAGTAIRQFGKLLWQW